jgi:hypothetical protein
LAEGAVGAAAERSPARTSALSAGDPDPTLGEQFLDIAVAQGEAEIQPDRVLADLGREAMAAVA